MDRALGLQDAVIQSAAAQAGCRLRLPGASQDGFALGSVTAANPVAATRRPLLGAVRSAAPP